MVIGTITHFFGYQGTISQEDCIKLPIMNQIAAFFVLVHALRFKETWTQSEKLQSPSKSHSKKFSHRYSGSKNPKLSSYFYAF